MKPKPNLRKGMFYEFLNEGLFQKYCLKAGPVQELSISYNKKSEIKILNQKKVFDAIEIDFIGNFIEEKMIYEDNMNPISVKTELNNVPGTLFIKNNQFEDLILDADYETA